MNSLSSGDGKQLCEQRTQQGRLGLAVLLKFFQLEGRFPHDPKEVPLPAVEYLAEQLEVPALAWFDSPLKGRSGSRDREQLRTFRNRAAEARRQALANWLDTRGFEHAGDWQIIAGYNPPDPCRRCAATRLS